MSDTPIRPAKDVRDELAATLDELETRLNPKVQLGELNRRVRAGCAKNPVPYLIGAAAATAVVVGLIAWAIAGDD